MSLITQRRMVDICIDKGESMLMRALSYIGGLKDLCRIEGADHRVYFHSINNAARSKSDPWPRGFVFKKD